MRLLADIVNLRGHVAGHCERIAAQSAILSKHAERSGK
jgi:hypothetical protein